VDEATFISTVASRAGVPDPLAEDLTRATLKTLAERISGGEARDLRAQLPTGLREPLRSERQQAEPFDLEEFLRRVSDRAAVDMTMATRGARAVITTVREAVADWEFDDVLSQLPKEYVRVVEPSPSR
jgi:uncharacterized protein (DUF2267 family)